MSGGLSVGWSLFLVFVLLEHVDSSSIAVNRGIVSVCFPLRICAIGVDNNGSLSDLCKRESLLFRMTEDQKILQAKVFQPLGQSIRDVSCLRRRLRDVIVSQTPAKVAEMVLAKFDEVIGELRKTRSSTRRFICRVDIQRKKKKLKLA